MRYRKSVIVLGTLLLSTLLVFWQSALAGPPQKPGNPGLPGCLAEVADLNKRLDQLQSQALVSQTGQLDSYYPGDDGDHQAGVPWPTPRFTDQGDWTIKDNLTGLIWMKDANCDGTKAWTEAVDFCSNLADSMCGLNDGSVAGDWRLPNAHELASLIHWGFWNPALPNTAGTGQWSHGDPFVNVQSAGSPFYYTSTTYLFQNTPDTGEAWTVPMSSGGIVDMQKSSRYFVWCVRDAQ